MKSAYDRANVGNVRSGQRVGKYVLGEQIGRGGMAEVWSARAEGPGGFVKTLALKFISDSFAGDADLERLFVNEARVAAQLQHANLVSVFDFDKWTDASSGEPDRYYIAMERVDGQDLRRVLQVARHKGQRLSPALALHIAGEVLKGLRYVHERREEGGTRPLGLVHRDVSPHNVLVGMGGEVKLSDFGIAKAMSQSLGTQAGTIRGKLAYASPEQLSGEPVDHRADQFAVGVTFWEMLADRRLFEGRDEMEIVGKVLRCEIPPLAGASAVDATVESVVRRMLSRAPADRFPSTAGALSALMESPGYAPHAPALTDLMQALFAPRALVLPPTVPMQLPAPHPGRSGLAETSALEPSGAAEGTPGHTPSERIVALGGARSDSAPTNVTAAPVELPEIGTATGSGYVSADTPHVPSWVEQPEGEPPLTGRARWRVPLSLTVAGIGLAAGLIIVERLRSHPSAPADVSAGPRPSRNHPRGAASPLPPLASPAPAKAAEHPHAPIVSAGRPPLPPTRVAPMATAPPLPVLVPAATPPLRALPPAEPPGSASRQAADPVATPVPALDDASPDTAETGLEDPAGARHGPRRAAGRRSAPQEERRITAPAESQPSSSGPARKGAAANGAPILE